MFNDKLRVKLVKRERKDTERNSLIARIFYIRTEMAPCSFCVRRNRRYVVDSKELSRCVECVRHRRPHCNFINKLPFSRDWKTIDK